MSVLRKLERQQVVSEEILGSVEDIIAQARAGTVTSILVVADHGPEGELTRVCSFDDRLRILGALEYMKASIHRSGE